MISYETIEQTAKIIENTCGTAEIGIVLGSGLGDYANTLTDVKEISYEQIPGFPKPSVQGHAGKLVFGMLKGKKVMMMCGRFHYYEGFSLDTIAMPIRVMRLLGVKTLILTNAAGGVNTSFAPGDLMLITDHINMTGQNPLRGDNMAEFGTRFPDMSTAYTPALRTLALECASSLNISLQQGVYFWWTGPTYETPAEIRAIRAFGGDAVGMSTVPETIVARHAGMDIIGISCITNMACGIQKEPLSHQEVMEAGVKVQGKFRALLDAIIEKL